MPEDVHAPGEIEQIIIKHGFGADFDQACGDSTADREELAYLYLAGLAAQSQVMRPTALAGLLGETRS
jgi:hypothetical protein